MPKLMTEEDEIEKKHTQVEDHRLDRGTTLNV